MPLARAPLHARSSGRRAALVAGVVLALLYGITAARDVTFWDVGEFLAAFHTFGIPHPPGTPLFVLLGRATVLALAPLGPVLPASLLSAACAAAAGALLAALLQRWTGRAWAAVGAAVCAGATSTIWLNATEAEVYSAALLLSACMLVVGERASRASPDASRWLVLLAYLFALAVPLHLSALVAAPTAALLASVDVHGRVDLRRLAMLAGALLMAAGAGRMSWALVALGTLVVGAASDRGSRATALGSAVAALVGVSGVIVLLVRARHDPPLDQGHAATWSALADVIARRQYVVAPMWPRQAPWWIQIANLGEWSDWQFALGLDGQPGPSPWRTPLTILYGALGLLGARDLRRANGRAFAATLALLLSGSAGVAAYLNLRAGPSFGWGVLPDGAPHEARERDYFFVLAFWTWGAWAGLGAAGVAERVLGRVRHRAWAGLALAAIPVATNWRATTRRRSPDEELPRALASGILASAPRGAVLLLAGDNDTYPMWYLQLAERLRPDVTPVTLPLLGAPWYRAELARRHQLLPPDTPAHWDGTSVVARQLADAAMRAGRPFATSVGVDDSTRVAVGGVWALTGLVWVRTSIDGVGRTLDRGATERTARALTPTLFGTPRPGSDGAAEWAQTLLHCPGEALAGSLEDACNSK